MQKHAAVSGSITALLLFVTLAISLCAVPVYSQSSACVENLSKAQKLYEAGKLNAVPKMLAACTGKFETKTQQITAYRYTILSYIYTDNIKEASAAFEQLLRYDKEFKPSNTDPNEFKKLYRSFRTSPVFTAGPRIGTNWSSPSQLASFGVHNTNELQNSYTQRTGSQFGAMADLLLVKGLELSLSLQYTSAQFGSQISLYGFTNQAMEEQQNLIEAPLTIRYYFFQNAKLRPFLEVGASGSYLLSSSISPQRSIDNQVIETGNIEGTSIDLLGSTPLRRQLNYSLLGGAGIKYKISGGFLFIIANYAQGMQNQAIPNNRYANNELTFRYGYITDDFTLDRLSVNFGYQIAIYNPKKLKQ